MIDIIKSDKYFRVTNLYDTWKKFVPSKVAHAQSTFRIFRACVPCRKVKNISTYKFFTTPVPTAADCATLAAEAPVLGVGDRPTPAGVPAHELSSASGRKLQLQSRSIADSCQPGTDQEWCYGPFRNMTNSGIAREQSRD